MFNNFEYVYEVYKESSFSRAADNLYISQPSLSATIRKVEKRIGCKLFDRSTNPIQLTDCGREYIRAAEQVMDIQNRFEQYVNNWDELKTGSLSIGASSFFTSFILATVVADFKQKYRGVTINLVEAETSRLEQLLFEGKLDLIVDNFSFDSTIYDRRFFYKENLILAVPAKFIEGSEIEGDCLSSDDIIAGAHLSPATKCASFEQFAQMPCILLRNGNDTRDRFESMYQDINAVPNVILELDQLATSFNVVSQGLGISLVSDTLVNKVHPGNSVVYYAISSQKTQREIYFYYKRSKYVTRAMEELINEATKNII